MHSGIHESHSFLSNFHVSRTNFSAQHASCINPLPPSKWWDSDICKCSPLLRAYHCWDSAGGSPFYRLYGYVQLQSRDRKKTNSSFPFGLVISLVLSTFMFVLLFVILWIMHWVSVKIFESMFWIQQTFCFIPQMLFKLHLTQLQKNHFEEKERSL